MFNRFGGRVDNNADGEYVWEVEIFVVILFRKDLINGMLFINFEFKNVGSILMKNS
ncbi:MAG: hypothetical protein RMJ36_04510 [Candidatus Calescibacterium sp.]|nr:hypothetical protein [Candidatus Calescibacterium sp.]MDW8132896.1 hypothetical protein [Candidatus Calescibacterium sp.]